MDILLFSKYENHALFFPIHLKVVIWGLFGVIVSSYLVIYMHKIYIANVSENSHTQENPKGQDCVCDSLYFRPYIVPDIK